MQMVSTWWMQQLVSIAPTQTEPEPPNTKGPLAFRVRGSFHVELIAASLCQPVIHRVETNPGSGPRSHPVREIGHPWLTLWPDRRRRPQQAGRGSPSAFSC